jgi:Leucine-rich repeat (LRR) protein
LEISKNNFHFADLSVFSDLSNLETLRINSNPFYGSLKLIKNLKKLKKLDISDTDVDSGLEYLSDSIEKFWCSADERKDAKCKTIYNLFANERGEVETEKNNEGRTCVKNFSQKFQEYKHKGSAEMENLNRERLERNLKKQQTRYLILQLQPFNPNK